MYFKTIFPKSRADLRRWLAENYRQKESVWVIIYNKESGRRNVSLTELTEEAICYGWIDSVPGKVDALRYKILLSPRKPKSAWSALNRKRVARLTKTGAMTKAGLAKVQEAKKNGAWNLLADSDRLKIPKNLPSALRCNAKAKAFFNAMAPSSKKIILEWLQAAKTVVTRQKRIRETVRLAAIGVRPNHYRDLLSVRAKAE